MVIIPPDSFAMIAKGTVVYEGDAPPVKGDMITVRSTPEAPPGSGSPHTGQAIVTSVDPDEPYTITAHWVDL